MKFIVYVSQAWKPFESGELRDLLKHSRKRNDADGITGLLVYRYNEDFDRGNFLQILEGPEDAIEDVWRRISGDKRHHTIVVIEEGSMDERSFADWSMGFKNASAGDLTGHPAFTDMGSDVFWRKARELKTREAMDLLTSFYEGT